MAQENVEIVRRFYETYNARDVSGCAALITEDFEFGSVFVGLEGRSYVGRAGLVDYFRDLDDAWDHFWLEVQEILDADIDTVVGLMHVHARGRTSGVDVHPDIASIFSMRDGRIAGLRTLTDAQQALRETGLAE